VLTKVRELNEAACVRHSPPNSVLPAGQLFGRISQKGPNKSEEKSAAKYWLILNKNDRKGAE
jgi:hypothetical protein